MNEVRLVGELVNNHSVEELIAYMDRIMRGVVGNCRMGLKEHNDAYLWSSIGDIAQVSAILKELESQRKAREAFKP